MKKILLVLLILISSSFVFADTLSTSAIITARKRGNNNGSHIPDAEASIRLSDGLSNDFGQNANVQIPVTARSDTYTAFTWYYSGNLYKEVTISFTFGPMKLLDDKESLGGSYTYVDDVVIPYTVYFSYNLTRIGNSVTNINKDPTNLRHEINYLTTPYYLCYADSVSLTVNNNGVSGLSGSASVVKSNAEFAVTADLSTYTVVYDAATAGNTVARGDFLNSFKDANENNLTPVCDHWVRSGSVMVDINIDGNGQRWTVDDTNGEKTQVTGGIYYADVTIGFMVN